MNQMENNNNNSSNSLVFGRWPQTKILGMPKIRLGASGRKAKMLRCDIPIPPVLTFPLSLFADCNDSGCKRLQLANPLEPAWGAFNYSWQRKQMTGEKLQREKTVRRQLIEISTHRIRVHRICQKPKYYRWVDELSSSTNLASLWW